MRSLTRLIFGMALAAAAPTASLLVMTYSQEAAAICSTIYGCGDNGPALTGTRFEKSWQGEETDAPEPPGWTDSGHCPEWSCGANGPALTGTHAEPGLGFPEAAEEQAEHPEGTNALSLQGLTIYAYEPGVTVNSVSLNGSSFQGLDPNGLRVNDAVGVADPSRLRLRAIRLPDE